jgi:hypothetical protein
MFIAQATGLKSIVNKFETSLTDDARVVIYDRHMFIVEATGFKSNILISGLSPLDQMKLYVARADVHIEDIIERLVQVKHTV